ncbi:MAG: pyrroline-5-carboxylate reductase [Phycisphaerales bacterium]|nr:pyrroline-5-carboxylate reductase [Phycisphaerales bacterium]
MSSPQRQPPTLSQRVNTPIIVFGGGVMGSAIIRSAISTGAVESARVCVIDPDAGKLEYLRALGIHTLCAQGETVCEDLRALRSTNAGFAGHWLVLFAVKPQHFATAAATYAQALRDTDIVLSIMAGITTAQLGASLPGKVVRAMPNTPAQIGLGVTGVCLGEGVNETDARDALALLNASGPVLRVIPESRMDALTALTGSGPAYVFYLAEALTAAAIKHGFTQDEADELVRGTIRGAAELLVASPKLSPQQLRAAVTSKGGTTQAACETLDALGVKEAFEKAVDAGTRRAGELSGSISPGKTQ